MSAFNKTFTVLFRKFHLLDIELFGDHVDF